ncbi:MAG: DUF1800 family protein [Myxococcota bacterium]
MARSTDAFVAASRFGLGARPGELAQIGVHARDWLLSQLSAPDPHVQSRLAALPSTERRVAGIAAMKGAAPEAREQLRMDRRDDYTGDFGVHLAAAAASTMPFRERLVAFWGNHLTVSIARKEVTPLVGPFEREVVRPGLDGSFADLVLASAKHPAMLAYLDNARSVGPDSWAGRKSGHGLNENYARELLELHTVGVDAGYGQADVEALAALLTGWTIDGLGPGLGRGMWPFGTAEGGFAYRPERHQPGARTVMGASYRDAEAAIRALAVHPATAQHVATRLARHFVADDPPLTVAALRRTRSWRARATCRACTARWWRCRCRGRRRSRRCGRRGTSCWRRSARSAASPTGRDCCGRSSSSGQLPYQGAVAAGWPDRAEAWIGGGAVLARLEWAEQVGRAARRAKGTDGGGRGGRAGAGVVGRTGRRWRRRRRRRPWRC